MNMKNYKISPFKRAMLGWITRKIVIQSHEHKNNIVTYYKILYAAARDEFTEDNKPTLDNFLSECHELSLKENGKMEKNELKVFYAGGLDEKIDKALEDCLKKFGYKRWASGMEMNSKIRDLSFEK